MHEGFRGIGDEIPMRVMGMLGGAPIGIERVAGQCEQQNMRIRMDITCVSRGYLGAHG